MHNASTIAARLESKIRRDPATGCWLWLSSTSSSGYGRFTIRFPSGCKTFQAHRVSYEVHVGPIPDGLTIDHLCRVRACINPVHLEPVTMRENSLRAPTSVNAIHARTTHCPQGHEYTPENTRVDKFSKRSCRTCHRTRGRIAARKRRAAASTTSRPRDTNSAADERPMRVRPGSFSA